MIAAGVERSAWKRERARRQAPGSGWLWNTEVRKRQESRRTLRFLTRGARKEDGRSSIWNMLCLKNSQEFQMVMLNRQVLSELEVTRDVWTEEINVR